MSTDDANNDPFRIPDAANQPSVSAMPQDTPPMGAVPVSPQAQPQPSPSPLATGQAQDLDDIESAWVSGVQEIFRRYGNDPRLLSSQFANLKADYIMKRYGKDIRNSTDRKS
jgi:hypothetical protein